MRFAPSGPHLLAVALFGCRCLSACHQDAAPKAQWVVSLSTDAQIPAFGGMLQLELIDDQGETVSASARRAFDVSHEDAWPISFGAVSERSKVLRVRARLYRSDQVSARGEPNSEALIDRTARLPELDDAPLRVQMPLAMSCFGVRPEPSEHLSCDPSSGELTPERTLSDERALEMGSWTPGRERECVGVVPANAVCIPGGAFILGVTNPDNDPLAKVVSPARIVQVSPFALDVDEISVGQVRALVARGELTDDGIDQSDGRNYCTYRGVDDSTHDAEPLNCVDWRTASQICALFDKRLPSEAEWDYAAGNLAAKTPFPWGADEDVCVHSVVAHGPPASDHRCLLDTGLRPGPLAGGHPGDVSELGVRNLAGNLSEWTSDFAAPYTAACWSDGGVLLVDPHCSREQSGAARAHMYRGAGWDSDGIAARVSQRYDNDTDDPMPSIGLRCARSMTGEP